MLIGGRYETIRELGRGSIGKTYLAEDTYRRGRPKCVVKKIYPSMKLPPLMEKARFLFEGETQAIYDLGKHDQIAHLLANFEQSGDFFTVQELIDGHDMRQAFGLGDRWDEKALVLFLREVLDILKDVHAHNVVHQDISPANLFRRWSDRKLVLIDFSGVKAIRHLTLTPEGEIRMAKPVGTPGYLAPELSQGRVSSLVDLYALGMMGIQALTGYLPNQLPRNANTQELEWHDQADASPFLIAILDKMVRYQPEERFQSAEAVLDALPDPNPTRSTNELSGFEQLLQEAKPPTYEVIIPAQFDQVRNFTEGLAAIAIGQKLGYINRKGWQIVPAELDFDLLSLYRDGAYQFSEGLASRAIAHKWGYIDSAGEWVIRPHFASAEPFSDGLARVEINHHYGYINHTGKFIIPPKFESAAPRFQEGLAGVEIDHRYGYINTQGKCVIAPQFDTADEFQEGLARITLHDKYGFVDQTGDLVIPAQFDVAHTFQEGLARVRVDGKYGYIDKSGTLVIPAEFDDTFSFSEGLALVRNGDRYGFIDKSGAFVIPLQYDDAYPFSEGLAAAQLNQRWGFIDRTGTWIVEPQFEDASSFHGGLAAVKLGNKWGFLGEAS